MKTMKNKSIRSIKGTVVSDKMDKTIVVEVQRYASHPKYKKRYRINKKYYAHDPQNKTKVGDQVIIIPSRPLSRLKRWKIKENITQKQ